MRLFSEICQKTENSEVTPERIRSYALALADIRIDRLEVGLRECSKHCKFFPTAVEIRERTYGNLQLDAESAWEALQKIIFRDWHPDVGWQRKVELPPAMEFAIDHVGGLRKVHGCRMDDVQFLRRDFIAAHQRFQLEGGAQVRMSRELAAKVHDQIAAALAEQRKALPPTLGTPARTAVKETASAAPRKEFTQADYDKRMALLEEQKRQLLSGGRSV